MKLNPFSKFIMLVMASAGLCSLVQTGFAAAPYSVDDPGTPEKHKLFTQLFYISSQVRGSEAQQTPVLSLSYGATENVELDFGTGAASYRNSGSSRVTGLGDTSTGFKWRFKEETKSTPQFAFAYSLKIPTASQSRGLGSGKYDNTIAFDTAKSFGRATLFGNVGYNFVGDHQGGKDNTYYGAVTTYQATEKIEVGIQVYGNTAGAPGARDELAYGIGFIDNYLPDRALKLSIGRSAHGFSDLNIFVGLKWVTGPKP